MLWSADVVPLLSKWNVSEEIDASWVDHHNAMQRKVRIPITTLAPRQWRGAEQSSARERGREGEREREGERFNDLFTHYVIIIC